MGALRMVLGDQLSMGLTALGDINRTEDVIFMCEVSDETTYVKHHQKKIVFILSAMRHFAADLKKKGYHVDYVHLDDKGNTGSFTTELARAIKRHKSTEIITTFPGEYRVLEMMQCWESQFGIPVSILPDDRFLCDADAFAQWAHGRKQLRMEYFYREMRQRYDVLMENGQPAGGQWNYDTDNRKKPPANITIPKTYQTKPDAITQSVIALVSDRFKTHFGHPEPFHYAVTRRQALKALKLFINERLADFGDYQDAMLTEEPWMFHAHIALYMNVGLLTAKECIDAAAKAGENGSAPLNAVEGFIRQILGWREYIRGIYWLKMPDYANENYFNAKRPLPDFFWTGNTNLNCLKQSITNTQENAYAHHIQRLMVLGNFLLSIGAAPAAVSEWYLLVYADAFEWVELPNVFGMALFADGGVLASKPYLSGGAYVNKMSNYCKGCKYKVKQKTGPDACPFNYLYWNFLMTHQKKLGKNPRMAMMYRTLEKMPDTQRQRVQADAKLFIDSCYQETSTK
jgi:deoxyribodipyrimidine photolyase-related protein